MGQAYHEEIVQINTDRDLSHVVPPKPGIAYPEYHVTQIPDHFRIEATLHQDVMGIIYLLVADMNDFGNTFWIKVWISEEPEPGRMIQ